LRYRGGRILATWLAAMLVYGAAAAALQAAGWQARPDHWTRYGSVHGVPAPMPRPGNWALALAGLIGAGAIVRRRVSFMRHRTLVVLPPTAVPPIADASQARDRATRAAGGRAYLNYCLAAGLLLWPAGPPQAQDAPDAARVQDPAKLTPFVEETLTTDDNVFRISKDVDPAAVIGSSSRGDTYRTTSVGLNAEMPLSLQRFVANLTFNSTRYQRFSGLDYDGHDLRARWLWQFGRDMHGELGYADTVSLASFAQLLSTTPDRLRVRQEFVNGTWMVTPDWRLRAAGDHLEQRNNAPATLFNDVTVDAVEAALSRVSKAGNSIGFSTRLERGKFPTAEPFTSPLSTTLIDNAYRQYAAGLTLDWTVTGVSHLVARADQVSRRYDQLPQRNFTGQTGRIELTWTPTGKMSLTAIAQRDISPYEFTRSSLVLIKGFGLRPAWHVTPKIDLSADLEAVTRSYVADAAQALGLSGQRDDRGRSMSALFSYHPSSSVTLQANVLHETRSSNIAFGDYAANVAWINARFAF
jgi:exopolysaccharide biosynthesis operon protein EpsL